MSRKRIGRLMRKMGLCAIYQKPRTPHPAHKVYPCLLKNRTIDAPNLVWCTDITYTPIAGISVSHCDHGLVSRNVLTWRMSSTVDTEFCVAALEETLSRYGKPAIFNTDRAASLPVMPLPRPLSMLVSLSAYI